MPVQAYITVVSTLLIMEGPQQVQQQQQVAALPAKSWSSMWTSVSEDDMNGWVSSMEEAADVIKAFEVSTISSALWSLYTLKIFPFHKLPSHYIICIFSVGL